MALSSIPGFGYGGRCDAEDGCVTVRIITAHVLDGLAQIEDESVHCVVTSPPYYGLRDYGGMANPPVGMTQV
jgi:hypothetical protein